MKHAEFDGVRSQLYKEAMNDYPDARKADIETMLKLLHPHPNETVLCFGEGTGYFSPVIAHIAKQVLVTDPSRDQLEALLKQTYSKNIQIKVGGIEELDLPERTFDKVWSFGALHHANNQTKALQNIYGTLKPNGTVVICDVFQGSTLAQHFDEQVARYCITGHEVKFLSDVFARSLCYLAGFRDENVRIVDLPQRWEFATKQDIAIFIYKLHAMILLPGAMETKYLQTLNGCERILGIEQKDGKYLLNWPMKALIAKK